MWRTSLAVVALAVLAVLAAAGSGAAAPAAAKAPVSDRSRPPSGFLHVGGVGSDGLRQIVDSHGRSVLLRGVNVDGLVDYWQPGLRPPYPHTPAAYARGRCPADDPHVEGVELCRYDFRQMQAEGYDAIRLNVSWSLLEPRPGRIDRGYLARIAQVVRWARAAGIWVVIDLHQDAWSKYVFTPPGSSCPPPLDPTVGYDGAPRWALTSRLPACTVDNTRELDLAVQQDAQAFWSDQPASDGVGLQEHYARVVAVLARRFAHDPAVAGYDVMNEPEPGFAPEAEGTAELLPFYAKVARTVTRRVPKFRQLLFLEPGVERNTTAAREFFTSWSRFSSYRNAVYAPHVYTHVFTAGAVAGTPDPVTFRQDYGAAVDDARSLGLPLWIGEFGCAPRRDADLLRQHYGEQESLRIGGTLWLWKENANDEERDTFWGVYGPPFTGRSARGVPQPERIRRTSRVYPVATFGRLLTATSDPFRGTARLVATSPRRVGPGDRAHATVVRVPAVFRGRVVVRGGRFRTVRRGGARTVWVFPRRGRYSLTVH